jgi:hypothetical protein
VVRRWHADPFGFLRPWNELPAHGPGGGTVYRLRVREVAPDRPILETENVGTIRVLLMPLFKPGELRTLYVVEWDARDVWSFYSLTGTIAGASLLARGHVACERRPLIGTGQFTSSLTLVTDRSSMILLWCPAQLR